MRIALLSSYVKRGNEKGDFAGDISTIPKFLQTVVFFAEL